MYTHFPSQLLKLTEEDLAPRWYEPEIRSKQCKLSTTATKDLEKRKKAATNAADKENEILGTTISTRR